MPLATFPSLPPDFFSIDELPDYGLLVNEDEVGNELRRTTETTGYQTKIKFTYGNLNSEQLLELMSFYRGVKGLFSPFLLPNDIFINTSEYDQALLDLEDTSIWRFESPPVIDTVLTDILKVDIYLISLKENEPVLLDYYFGYPKPLTLSLNLSSLVSESFEYEDVDTIELNTNPIIPTFDSYWETNSVELGFNFNILPLLSIENLETLSFNFYPPTVEGNGNIKLIEKVDLGFIYLDIIGDSPVDYPVVAPNLNLSAIQQSQDNVDDFFVQSIDLNYLITDKQGVVPSPIPVSPFALSFDTSTYQATNTGILFTLELLIDTPTLPVIGDDAITITKINLNYNIQHIGHYSTRGELGMELQNWNSNFTTEPNTINLVDTSSGNISGTLPPNPFNGQICIFSDANGSSYDSPDSGFGLNSFTILANTGQNVQGESQITMDRDNSSLSLIYNAPRWTIFSSSF